MINLFSENLRKLRENRGLSQLEAAASLNLSRSTYANYESGENFPKADVMLRILSFLSVRFEDMMTKELSAVQEPPAEELSENTSKGKARGKESGKDDPRNNKIELYKRQESATARQLLPTVPAVVVVDGKGKERIPFVPITARAGYLVGYNDPEFISGLDYFNLPGYRNATYRLFEVQGDSMGDTFKDKDLVIARWEPVAAIKDDRCYVIATVQGLLIKRCLNRIESDFRVICKSDNLEGGYDPIILQADEVNEAWYITARVTKNLSRPGIIFDRVSRLEGEMALLKERLGRRPDLNQN